jgi:hypothetical protein
MTFRSFAPLAVVFTSFGFTVACGPESSEGPEKVDLAIADASEALTSKANDKLFTLTLQKSSKSYALADISVDVGFPGETRTAVNFKHEDTNGDGLLNPGESLVCSEPPVNLWDDTRAGKVATVALAERRNGTLFQVGTVSWNPN